MPCPAGSRCAAAIRWQWRRHSPGSANHGIRWPEPVPAHARRGELRRRGRDMVTLIACTPSARARFSGRASLAAPAIARARVDARGRCQAAVVVRPSPTRHDACAVHFAPFACGIDRVAADAAYSASSATGLPEDSTAGRRGWRRVARMDLIRKDEVAGLSSGRRYLIARRLWTALGWGAQDGARASLPHLPKPDVRRSDRHRVETAVVGDGPVALAHRVDPLREQPTR